MIAQYERKHPAWQYPPERRRLAVPADLAGLHLLAIPRDGSLKDRDMSVKQSIEKKLTEALAPLRLRITDESHRHQGHGGAHPEGESHFDLEIVSQAFEGQSAVARQRLVYGLLADELNTRVHALSLKTLTPGEAQL